MVDLSRTRGGNELSPQFKAFSLRYTVDGEILWENDYSEGYKSIINLR